MKQYANYLYFIFLGLGTIGVIAYLIPIVWNASSNASYRFVLFFLLLILGSNAMAKIAYKYITA